jgi:hypothetical protein
MDWFPENKVIQRTYLDLQIFLGRKNGKPNNSIEQTPRAGKNSDLDQASGSSKMIGEVYRRCSSQDR